jgi:hypothetical protein
VAAQAGRTGDAGTPTPVVSPAYHSVSGPSARPLLGYVRVPTAASDRQVECLRRELAGYAGSEGFVLLRVFVDRNGTPTTGFSALFRTLCGGPVRHVVVPTLDHFAVVNGIRVIMKELLEQQLGTRILVARSTSLGLL